MSKPPPPPPPPAFSPSERTFLRQSLAAAFGHFPRLSAGIALTVWTTGPHRGEAKVPPVLAGLVARGIMDIPAEELGRRAYFTQTGLGALRALYEDGRYLDPERYGHLAEELGL